MKWLTLALLLFPLAALPQTPAPPAALQNIEEFIDHCPASDPAYATIRADFKLRRDGVLVGEVACTEPYTRLPLAQYTDELLVLQSLRLAYYMDQGRANYLPWTPLRLYDWMKTKIGGINIDSKAAGSSCCFTFDGRPSIDLGATTTDTNREYHLTLRGVLSNIALFGHESRHVDGYLHVSCCGITGGCDAAYDEKDLTAYGVQYYLWRLLVTGGLPLNLSCLDNSLLGSLGTTTVGDPNGYITRFCTTQPPVVPAQNPVGGACIAGTYSSIALGGVGSLGSYSADQVAVGGLIVVAGSNLSTTAVAAPGVPYPTSMAGVTLEIDGKPAPLVYVSPGQINAQAPYESAVSPTVTALVKVNGTPGFRRAVSMHSVAPAFFVTADNHVIAQNSDGTVNTRDNPAVAGSYVTLYFTGQGPSKNPVATGAPAPDAPLSPPLAAASIKVGALDGTILYAGLTPETVGLSQVNVQLMEGYASGDYPVQLKLGTAVSNTPVISIAAR